MRSFATSGGALALCLVALTAQARPVRYSLSGPEPPHATVVGHGHRYRGFVLQPGRSLAATVRGPGVLRLLYFQDYIHGREFPGTVRVMVSVDQVQRVDTLSPRAQDRLDYRPRRRNRTRPSAPIPILLLIRSGAHAVELRLPPAVPYPATVVFENARRVHGGLGLDLGLGPLASNTPPPQETGNLAVDLDLPPTPAPAKPAPAAAPENGGLDLGLSPPTAPAASAPPPASGGLDLGLASAAPAPASPPPASGGLDLGLAPAAPAAPAHPPPSTSSGLDLGLASAAPTPASPAPASGGLDLGLAPAAPAAPAHPPPPGNSGLDLGLASAAPTPSSPAPASGGLDLGLAPAAPAAPAHPPPPGNSGLDLGLASAAPTPSSPAPASGGLDLGLAPAAATPPSSGSLALATPPAPPPPAAAPLPPVEAPAPQVPAAPTPSTFVAVAPAPPLAPPPVSPRPRVRRWRRQRQLAEVAPSPPPKLGVMEIGAQAGWALAQGDLKGGQGLYLVELGYRLSKQGHPNFRVVLTSGYSLLSGTWTGIDPGHGIGSFYQNTTLIPMELGFTWEPWGPGGVSPYVGLAFAGGLASTSLQRFSLPQAQSLGATVGVTAELGLRLQAGIGSFVFELRHTESVAGLANLAQLAQSTLSASALTGGYLVSF